MRYALRVMQHGHAPYAIKIEALNPAEARLQAERQGLVVLQVKQAGTILWHHAHTFPLLLFCQEFRVLLEAGLPVVDVLETLIQKETNTDYQSQLKRLLNDVSSGQTLSQGMAYQPEIFPNLLIASVRSAETTGNLTEALSRYSQYAENVDLLKKRIISASVYPAIVVSFGLLVLAFLLGYVIPKFANIYQTQVHTASASTRFVLWLADFSQHYGVWVLVAVGGMILAIFWALSQKDMRSKIAVWAWQWPYVGEKIRIYHLSRLYRTFAMLLKSGLTVDMGLSQLNSMLSSDMQHSLQHAQKHVREGKGFSDAFEVSRLTTPVSIRLFRVGEKTGTLAQMMERAADFHEEQMLRWVDRFTKVFEPTLMALIGVLIGGIVLMMYLPIFELASGID